MDGNVGYGWVGGWTRMDGWMNRLIGWWHVGMDVWVAGQIDGQTDGLMDGWVSG